MVLSFSFCNTYEIRILMLCLFNSRGGGMKGTRIERDIAIIWKIKDLPTTKVFSFCNNTNARPNTPNCKSLPF